MLARLRARHSLFPLIVGVHLLLIAILLLAPGAPIKADIKVASMNTINIAGPEKETKIEPVEPVEQQKEVIAPEPVVKLPSSNEVLAGPVFDVSAASAAGFGESCAIGEALGRAFQSHAALRQALADWPSQARSVSGAIMLWDGAWVLPDAQMDPASLALIHRGVVEGIRAAPEECLDESIVGPRLVIVPTPDSRSAVLVLGSGTWAWRQILDHEDERLRSEPPAASVGASRATPVPSETLTSRMPNPAAPRHRSPL